MLYVIKEKDCFLKKETFVRSLPKRVNSRILPVLKDLDRKKITFQKFKCFITQCQVNISEY